MSKSQTIKVGLSNGVSLKRRIVLSAWRSERFWDCRIRWTLWATAISWRRAGAQPTLR